MFSGKLPSAPSVPRLPTLGTPDLVKGALYSPFQSQSTGTPSTDTPITDEPAGDEPLIQESPTELPVEKQSLAKGQVVYLVMQPVVSASRLIAGGLQSQIRQYFKGFMDLGALLALLLAEHWAVLVDGQYYHLKRMTDDSLALDITPFAEDAIFLKIPLWKTNISHEDRGGIAIRILAEMMSMTKDQARSIRVEQYGNRIDNEIFLFTKYRSFIYRPSIGKGSYSAAFNNCQHFVQRFFYQVFTPNGPMDLLEWPSIAKELWFSNISKASAVEVLQRIRSNDLSVGFLLETLLKRSAGAAKLDVSKSAAGVVEIIESEQKVVTSLLDQAQKLAPASEKARQAVTLAAELVSRKAMMAKAASNDEPTDQEKAQSAAAENTSDMKDANEVAKAALEELEIIRANILQTVDLVALHAKTARALANEYKNVMETAAVLGVKDVVVREEDNGALN